MRKKSKQGRRVLAATRARVAGEESNKSIEADEDMEFQEEDLTFLEEYGDSLNFLTKFTAEDLEKYVFALVSDSTLCRKPEEKLKMPARLEGHDGEDSDVDNHGELVEVVDDDAVANDSDDDSASSVSDESEASADEDQDDDDDDDEHPRRNDEDIDYEARLSTTDGDKWINPTIATRLPIKGDDGIVRQVRTPLVVDRKEGDELIYQEEKKKRVARKEARNDPKPPVKPVNPDKMEKLVKLDPKAVPEPMQDPSTMNSSERQERLAEIATKIIEEPEKNVCGFLFLFTPVSL